MRYLLMLVLCAMIPLSGVSGGAIDFDGADDYVDSNINTFSVIGTGDMSFFVWVNPTLTAANLFLSWFGSASVNSDYLGMRIETDSKLYVIGRVGTVGQAKTAAHPDALSTGAWYHVGFTRSGTTIRTYINGVSGAANTDAEFGGSLGGVGDVRALIGAFRTGIATFSGLLDEVLIYNVTLTAAEISDLYGAGKGPPNTKRGLISRYAFDDNGVSTGQAFADGSAVKDSYGSNDGTVNDGADGSMTLEPSPVRKARGRR